MSNTPIQPTPPPIQPPERPALDYQKPTPTSLHTYNRWWMVLLRIVAGIPLGAVAFLIGLYLVSLTEIQLLLFLPPALMLAALLIVPIKFKRFGYITGFIMGPFILIGTFAVILFCIILVKCS